MTLAVELKNISKIYDNINALKNVNLKISDGEFFSLLGPSGSGKTTCLKIIAGFEQANQGYVYLFGDEVSNVPPYKRKVNTVFQDYALFPHMSVGQNIGYSLKIRNISKTEQQQQVKEILEIVKLSGYEDRRTNQLSGGQKQRISIARAVLKNSPIILLDEATSSLDAISEEKVQNAVINLLPRFYDPKEGKIYIDEQNIRSITLSSLRKNISMVSQDIILFDDTVRANIAYANMNASEKQIKDACDFAAATEFIDKLPEKFETIIGENGIRLSGGQKQRISIARAVLKNSPIILLDEATSSLDAESEEKVQNAVMNLTKNKTTLVIAHRLSTIIRADKIIVLNQGKITDIGTHKELLQNSVIYKNLYSKQLSA